MVSWLRSLESEVVVEFPHHDDPMVQRLLASKRKDAHPDYELTTFEALLESRFDVVESARSRVGNSDALLRPPGVSARLPSYRVRAVHLTAVWAYAVSQPVFSLIEGNPEFLVVRGSTRSEVVVLAVLLGFGPPSAALAVSWLLSRVSSTLGDAAYLLALLLFFIPLALQVTSLVDPRSPEMALLAVWAITLFGVAAYVRFRVAQLFLAFSVILPLLGFLSFVIGTRVPTDDFAHARPPAPAARTPVVLLVFDELPISSLLTREGVVDRVRYPNFARLQRDATWYPNATTVHEHTTAAVPAILTGVMPAEDALPVLADHRHNLFTLVGGTYAMNVHEEVTYLCPTSLCPRQSAGFSSHLIDLVADLHVAYLHRVLPGSLARELAVPEIGDRWRTSTDNNGSRRQSWLPPSESSKASWIGSSPGSRTEPCTSFICSSRTIPGAICPPAASTG